MGSGSDPGQQGGPPMKNGGLLYLVEWKGFDHTPNTTSWELPKHLENAADLVQAFHMAYPDKPLP